MATIYIYKPHEEELKLPILKTFRIFLAGTIDNGDSENWQQNFIDRMTKIILSDKTDEFNYVLYNPRRDDWAEPSVEEMEYQVNWELEHLENSDKIIMNILGNSKSPISLMELGAFKNKNITVICEPNYYRYDNVRIFCERYKIPLFMSMDEYIENCE